MFDDMPRIYKTRRAAQYALDRQRVNGFAVNVGTETSGELPRYFVTHPTRGLWVLIDRQRQNINDPVCCGTIAEVLSRVF